MAGLVTMLVAIAAAQDDGNRFGVRLGFYDTVASEVAAAITGEPQIGFNVGLFYDIPRDEHSSISIALDFCPYKLEGFGSSVTITNWFLTGAYQRSFNERAYWGIGIGVARMTGADTNTTNFAYTLLLGYRFSESVALEVRYLSGERVGNTGTTVGVAFHF